MAAVVLAIALAVGTAQAAVAAPAVPAGPAMPAGHAVHAASAAIAADTTGAAPSLRVAAPATPLTLVAPTPTVVGTAVVGRTLTVSTGSWGPGVVTLTYRWNRDGVPIVGAGSKSYTVTAADVDAQLSVSVKGAKSGYTPVTLASASTPPVPPGALTATPTPTISGVLAVGSILTARGGLWTPSVVSLSYQWLRGGVPIAGAVAARYTVTADDAGQQLSVAATGAKTGYEPVTTTSAPLAGVPVITVGVPTVAGTPAVGQTLTSPVPDYSPGGVGLFYSWFRDAQPIDGATRRTYTVTAADLGTHLSIRVSANKTGFAPIAVSSAPTDEVYDATPLSGSVPVITGEAEIGGTLTADAGSWTPEPDTIEYQWYRDDVPLPAATTDSYTLTDDDAGTTLTVATLVERAHVASVRSVSLPVAVAAKPVEGDEGYDVVVILGQSNAQGAGLAYDPVLDAPVEGLDQFAGSGPAAGTIIPAVDSLYGTSQWLSSTGTPRVGPGMQFGRELLATEPEGRRVLLVPVAEKGTSVSGDAYFSWDPENTTARTNLYDRALDQIGEALASGPNNRLVAIIWGQGESDAMFMTGDAYQAKLLEIVDGLRSHYGTVPFLIGGMVPEWERGIPASWPIENAFKVVAGQRDDVAYVPGVSGFMQQDVIHFTAAGARMMGHDYFEAYAALRAHS